MSIISTVSPVGANALTESTLSLPVLAPVEPVECPFPWCVRHMDWRGADEPEDRCVIHVGPRHTLGGDGDPDGEGIASVQIEALVAEIGPGEPPHLRTYINDVIPGESAAWFAELLAAQSRLLLAGGEAR